MERDVGAKRWPPLIEPMDLIYPLILLGFFIAFLIVSSLYSKTVTIAPSAFVEEGLKAIVALAISLSASELRSSLSRRENHRKCALAAAAFETARTAIVEKLRQFESQCLQLGHALNGHLTFLQARKLEELNHARSQLLIDCQDTYALGDQASAVLDHSSLDSALALREYSYILRESLLSDSLLTVAHRLNLMLPSTTDSALKENDPNV